MAKIRLTAPHQYPVEGSVPVADASTVTVGAKEDGLYQRKNSGEEEKLLATKEDVEKVLTGAIHSHTHHVDDVEGLREALENNQASFLKEEFTYTNSNTFSTSQPIENLLLITVNGRQLVSTQYTYNSESITVLDEFEGEEKIIITYNSTGIFVDSQPLQEALNAIKSRSIAFAIVF